jgi:YggT family protein
VGAVVVSNGISNFLNLYNTVLVVRLVLTWFPNTHPAIVGPQVRASPHLSL